MSINFWLRTSTVTTNRDFFTVSMKICGVIMWRSIGHVGTVEAAERSTMIIMALTVDANGKSLPPFFLYLKKNMQNCYFDNASSDTGAFANGSEWMNQASFVRFHRVWQARASFAYFTASHLSVKTLYYCFHHTAATYLDLSVKVGENFFFQITVYGLTKEQHQKGLGNSSVGRFVKQSSPHDLWLLYRSILDTDFIPFHGFPSI